MDRWSLAVLLALTSCEPGAFQNSGRAGAPSGQGIHPGGGGGLLVYGGPEHRAFLGCFCNEYDPASLFNQYGKGSQYQGDSIFNRYGQYGSPYSAYSACAPYANDPPVIVDSGGGFHGRLTVNAYHPQRVRDERVLAWLQAVCARD